MARSRLFSSASAIASPRESLILPFCNKASTRALLATRGSGTRRGTYGAKKLGMCDAGWTLVCANAGAAMEEINNENRKTRFVIFIRKIHSGLRHRLLWHGGIAGYPAVEELDDAVA